MLLLLILACSDSPPPAEEPESPPPERLEEVVLGPAEEDAFGFSLDATGPLLIGAPEGPLGRVYELVDEDLVLVFEEQTFGAGGFSVARDHTSAVLVGAPLAEDGRGQLYRNGSVVQTGNAALAAHIQVSGETILVSESRSYWLDGSGFPLAERLASSAFWNTQWTLGFAYGPNALQVGDTTWERLSEDDLAGYSLCAANFDSDPEQELAVGAPGLGKVGLLNPGETLAEAQWLGPESGRFGHALACQDELLLVGAPTDGDQLQGSVWAFEGTMASWSAETPLKRGEPWQQLGFSVAASPSLLAAGAPGNVQTPGRVLTWTR